MKKGYLTPELELVKFSFEHTLQGDDDPFNNLTHSIAQDIGEGGGELD